MTPQLKQVQVLVADSTPLAGQLIALALQRDPDLHAASVSPQSVVQDVQTNQPHVVILGHEGSSIPDEGFDTLKKILATSPQTRVIMLVNDENSGVVVNSLRWGARGVFCRFHPLEMLDRCVKQVHAGHLWVSPAALEFLLAALVEAPPRPILDARGAQLLSRREQEVIHWIVEGLSNREIAKVLGISEYTVKNYVYRIFDKLGVSNRVEAAMYAAARRLSVTAKPPRPESESSFPENSAAAGND